MELSVEQLIVEGIVLPVVLNNFEHTDILYMAIFIMLLHNVSVKHDLLLKVHSNGQSSIYANRYIIT